MPRNARTNAPPPSPEPRTAYGIRLTGTHRDVAALRALAVDPDMLAMAPWVMVSASAASAAHVLTAESLDHDAAQRLLARGADVVRVDRTAQAASFTSLRDGRVAHHGHCVARELPSLAQSVQPVQVPGDPPCGEAMFYIPCVGDGALKTMERLLGLGRDDFTVAEADGPDGPSLLVRVSAPPSYLLLRAREERAEGVTAFVRHGEGDAVWVEWSWCQPLAHHAAQGRRPAGHLALLSGDGRWRFVRESRHARSVYDAVVPRFDFPANDLVPVAGECRFPIHLRLAPGVVLDPELWVLDPAQFLALEALIESLSQEDLSRFTVARVEAPEGTRYVVREHVRPGQSRFGGRLSDTVGSPGFARAVGTDNLYLPLGRQILPRVRRDEVRALFGLDHGCPVVVDDGPGGPRVLSARGVDETPLVRWVDYVATDRRVELERLDEAAVFDWPELKVERPRKDPEASRAELRDDRPKPPRVRREPDPPAVEDPAAPADAPASDAALAALREEIRALEGALAGGGHDDPATWRELAWRKGKVGEPDEAAACLESALFFGGPSAEASASLAAHHNRRAQHADVGALVARERLAPAEAAWLAAQVLDSSLRGEADDGVCRHAARRFADPETPVSRRLAWVVCRTLHGRTGDLLGLTRAREHLLGGINERGLSDHLDIPRFVRFTLARQSGGGADIARARGDQLDALESLLAAAPAATQRGLDSLPAYVASIFAVGFARLGAGERGHGLLAPVEEDGAARDAPNRALLRLYRTRYVHVATRADADAWKHEVDAALGAVKEPRVKDRVEWLRKRSEWLRTGASEAVGAAAKPSVERALADAEARPESSLDALTSLMDDRSLFDFEARIVGQRMLRVGIRSGNDDLLADLLRATRARLARLTHPGHRAELVGECLRAAAVLHDAAGVDALLDAVVTLVRAPDAPATRDLLTAVTPGLAALRRLGAGDSARRFLDALVPSAVRSQREGIRLRAALAEGFLLLRDQERADVLIDEALSDAIGEGLDHVGRHEAGTAVLSALRHWPTAGRAPRCKRVFEALPRFADSFTASAQGVYETHKILMVERLVDALADDMTVADDRTQAWLAEEEQSTRRKILADWRSACGR